MGSPQRDAWMARFLAEEWQEQTVILRTLRGRLQRGMDAAEERDAAAVAAGKRPNPESPSREWVRAASLYFDGVRHMAQLQIEHAKLDLEARRVNGKTPMTDEEYQAQLQALGQDAVRALTREQFEAEVERRRSLPEPAAEP